MHTQSFTLVVAVTYVGFLALFLVGMVGNGREGTNEARSHRCLLLFSQRMNPKCVHPQTTPTPTPTQ